MEKKEEDIIIEKDAKMKIDGSFYIFGDGDSHITYVRM